MSLFKFKQFAVRHAKSAMKVGTDGVLLGAWADATDCQTILDIGSGTGLIALMLAQRNDKAQIDAVEPDKDAFVEMQENFGASPWAGRLTAIEGRIQELNLSKKYDLIVSNPPFFISGTKSPDQQRHSVRHNHNLSHDELIKFTAELIGENGKACFILPMQEGVDFIAKASKLRLHLTKQTDFISREGKTCERLLLEFQKRPKKAVNNTLIHYAHSNEWSENYKALTRDFYLKL